MKQTLMRWRDAILVALFGSVGMFLVMEALALHAPLRLVCGAALMALANVFIESFANNGGHNG